MKIKISNKRIRQILTIISWIIFIGLGIEAGTFISSALSNLLLEPSKAAIMWYPADLTSLYNFNQSYFITLSSLIIIVSILKALLFYLIVKILHHKKLNITQPFNTETGRFIFNIAYITLTIGLFSHWGAEYTTWLISEGMKMPSLEQLSLSGSDVWLFMSVTLFVIAHIFKKGIEIQTENELTV